MDNLNEMGLSPVSKNQLKYTNGGLILVNAELTKALLKPLVGAYQRGYDEAQNNCDCES
ncbi:hypothetical protein [Fodinibius halophilus]|uniref:Uncharacterized protein n=1 Tax=Fodinibius halophilus TaxID=1736908 RepID=A0A6M1T2R7_9BACT|nr:hypothetical protein [Fodinibius halophilus]NGP89756.1 hypothetical protein [Fodinibius halophilus]